MRALFWKRAAWNMTALTVCYVLSLALVFPLTSLAAPYMTWDAGNHVFSQQQDVVVVSPTLVAASTSLPLFTVPNDGPSYQVAAFSCRFGTASSSGTATIEVATAGTAIGSGTAQLTGTVSLAGTTNTTVNGTLIASPTNAPSGTSVNLVLGGTMTSLANGQCTTTLVRAT